MITKHVNNSINLAIIGSRQFVNEYYAFNKIIDIIVDNNLKVGRIISGGANGADTIAENFALQFDIPLTVYEPNWEKYGRYAGLKRNTQIVQRADYIIAFWDKKSKGTKDSISKAQKLKKPIFIVYVDDDTMINLSEGISKSENDDNYIFDFSQDNKNDDILYLHFGKKLLKTKTIGGRVSYYSYKLNKTIDLKIRNQMLKLLKKDKLNDPEKYQQLLQKAVLGLKYHPEFNLKKINVIVYPQSSSFLNNDLVSHIYSSTQDTILINDGIIKNDLQYIDLDYDKMAQYHLDPKTIQNLKRQISKAKVNGYFSIKNIVPQYRKFVINFLKFNVNGEKIKAKLYKSNILVVDDIVTSGTTFNEIDRILQGMLPENIYYYSLMA